MLPGAIAVSCGKPASSAATSFTKPRPGASGMRNCDDHATTSPLASSAASRSTGVGGRVFVPIPAVAAGSVNIDGADVLHGHAEHRRELLPQIVRRLRRGPAGELAVLDLDDGAGWPDRAVGVDGEIVGRLDPLGTLAERGGGVADIAGDVVLVDLGRTHMLPELALLRQAFPARPARLQLLHRLDGRPLILGNDAEEVALANHPDMGNAAHGAFIDALQRGTDGGRSHYPAVQHVGDAKILHVGEAAS